MNFLIWFPQVAERWPLLFIRPSLTPGTPRQLSQRDPRDVLLPGGRDVPQPCLSHQLPLCSPSLYEESLLQHRDHVSKRNQLVDLMHWLGCALTYCVDGWIWMAWPKWELKKLKLRIHWFSSSITNLYSHSGFGLERWMVRANLEGTMDTSTVAQFTIELLRTWTNSLWLNYWMLKNTIVWTIHVLKVLEVLHHDLLY